MKRESVFHEETRMKDALLSHKSCGFSRLNDDKMISLNNSTVIVSKPPFEIFV